MIYHALGRAGIRASVLLCVLAVLPLPTARGAAASSAPRAAVAFSPDGATLAVGGYRQVDLVDSRTGQIRDTLGGHPGAVTGVAFSPDGKTLAASGGVPGRSGEIRLWTLATRTSRTLTGPHTDVVYSIAWDRTGNRLVAGSYDRLVSLWDVATGQSRRLKDHTDAVYSVAFSPDGSRIASASGDRTVKVWDATTGRRIFTLSEATAELYAVAFHPSGAEIAAGGADRMLRKWSVTATAGSLSRSAFAHDGALLRIAYTPDGSAVFTTAQDQAIKLWDSRSLSEKKVLERQPDWALGMALSPDGRSLAVSRYDGSLAVYDAETGQKRFDRAVAR